MIGYPLVSQNGLSLRVHDPCSHKFTLCGTKGEFAAFAREAAFVRFADLHLGLHTSCTPKVATTLIQSDGLFTPPGTGLREAKSHQVFFRSTHNPNQIMSGRVHCSVERAPTYAICVMRQLNSAVSPLDGTPKPVAKSPTDGLSSKNSFLRIPTPSPPRS